MGRHHEVRISGFGGQGVIMAGYVIGKAAAVCEDRHATFNQSYGPEARGSACSASMAPLPMAVIIRSR